MDGIWCIVGLNIYLLKKFILLLKNLYMLFTTIHSLILLPNFPDLPNLVLPYEVKIVFPLPFPKDPFHLSW